MLCLEGKAAMGRSLCWEMWVSEGVVVWSEGQCWTWIKTPPPKRKILPFEGNF
jgi:hypothetical protein